MNALFQRVCVWSGIACMVCFFTGLVIAQMLPPPSPSLSQEQVVAIFQENTNAIRTGFLFVFMSTAFALPFFGVISVYLRRIENREFPVFSFVQMVAAGTNGAAFLFPPVFMLIASFRPERSPEITHLLFDMSWIMLVIVFPANMIQCLAIGSCILSDKREQPILPRWVGYLNFWVAVGFLPAVVLVFVKDGPFAWNGIFPFWIPATVFGAWFIVMTTGFFEQ